ncbi:hypothetical protein DSECCO2_580770 [anaerobic digester metagenome]
MKKKILVVGVIAVFALSIFVIRNAYATTWEKNCEDGKGYCWINIAGSGSVGYPTSANLKKEEIFRQ